MIISCTACGLQYDVRSYPAGTTLQCRCSALLTVPEHELGAIRCPSCGGTIEAKAQRCRFCHTQLTRRNCPKCFAALREEARFCDQCGASVRPLTADTMRASTHDCPRCQMPLFFQTCSEYPVEVCGQCLGMWLDHETLEHIYRDAPKRLESVAPQALPVADPGAANDRLPPQRTAYIPCPVCKRMMNPTNYARRSGVIIDVCRDHGTWFDADELNKILEFNASGGVEKSRLRDVETARAQLAVDRLSAEISKARTRFEVQSHSTQSDLFACAMSWILER
ncbi:MAG: zf-TFIIB domain-containing protein [Deltaproteobacteria bacterium]|nr:zf-TFIIB domain-containing protein [Deltaproteobacteria bacterium]